MTTALLFIGGVAAFLLGWSSMGVAADRKAARLPGEGFDIIGLLLFIFSVASFVQLAKGV